MKFVCSNLKIVQSFVNIWCCTISNYIEMLKLTAKLQNHLFLVLLIKELNTDIQLMPFYTFVWVRLQIRLRLTQIWIFFQISFYKFYELPDKHITYFVFMSILINELLNLNVSKCCIHLHAVRNTIFS